MQQKRILLAWLLLFSICFGEKVVRAESEYSSAQLDYCEAKASPLSPESIALLHNHRRLRELQETSADSATRIRLATYNVNRLNFRWLANRAYSSSRELWISALRHYLLERRPAAISIQELWHNQDQEKLEQLASSLGYQVVALDRVLLQKTGLQILVAQNLEILATEFIPFLERGAHVRAFLEGTSGVYRGALITTLRDGHGRSWSVINTHFTPISQGFRIRERQLEALGHIVRARVALNSGAVFVLADLNIAADFSGGTPGERERLERVRRLYPRALECLRAWDAYRCIHGEEQAGYTTIPEFPRPFLLSMPTAAKRLDFILTHEAGYRVAVHASDLHLSNNLGIFPEPNALQPPAPSDHRLLDAELSIFN